VEIGIVDCAMMVESGSMLLALRHLEEQWT